MLINGSRPHSAFQPTSVLSTAAVAQESSPTAAADTFAPSAGTAPKNELSTSEILGWGAKTLAGAALGAGVGFASGAYAGVSEIPLEMLGTIGITGTTGFFAGASAGAKLDGLTNHNGSDASSAAVWGMVLGTAAGVAGGVYLLANPGAATTTTLTVTGGLLGGFLAGPLAYMSQS